MSRFTPENPSPLVRGPLTRSKDRVRSKTPLTPLQHLKKKFEEELQFKVKKDDEISPILYNLRNTPVKTLKEKQKVLARKHEEVRKRSDNVKVGGGVSLWPEMENMRLRHEEILQLIFTSLLLVLLLAIAFYKFHGSSLSSLISYTEEIHKFSMIHPVDTRNNNSLKMTLLVWHKNYRILIRKIEREFDMTRLSPPYQMFLLLYISAILLLVYFLIDNVFSKNKLSPRRIKNWVRLLILVTTWSVLISYWLIWAYRLEQSVHHNIILITDVLGDVIDKDLDVEVLNNVIFYWRTRLLPPSGRSLILILGVLPVSDVIHYLQYYSLPILTVILTPIVKLILALSQIYSWKKII
ncbi:hypothetical protein LOTGIDRAFT_152486 [Lottia gigantea]|uniref:Uncharacterized protein n=1 Tax=Lottia gigantea TaxID=225164 RepID=V4BCY5_LOTGI|nr:hypothetical protein LOTGIDRAFT_152486 [Lottia gigantea]ESP05626.1 hypothetical protein LOTGIDRAFT_152486 [Lottia gigantea]